jgi:hypothetical protein
VALGLVLIAGCGKTLHYTSSYYEEHRTSFSSLGIAPIRTGILIDEALIDEFRREIDNEARLTCGFESIEEVAVDLDSLFAAGKKKEPVVLNENQKLPMKDKICTGAGCPDVILFVDQFTMNVQNGRYPTQWE